MASTGNMWSGMLGLQAARFDDLEVWDPRVSLYINVVEALEDLEGRIGSQIESEDARITALEDKSQSLSENKADKFVAIAPLSLDVGTFPNELSFSGGPTPASASAINLNGEDAYIEFQGRTHVLDYTKDWSIFGCSIQTQGLGQEGQNMVCFSSGGCSLNLKVQGPPNGEGSNWGIVHD